MTGKSNGLTKKSSSLTRKSLLIPIVVLLAIFTFLSSLLYFSRQKPNTKYQIPNTKYQSLHVPEPNEVASESGVAVPQAAQSAVSGSKNKIRIFNIKAQNDSLSARKIIVNEGDIVRINFTAVDKQYDLAFPALGIQTQALADQTTMIEFQALSPGSFLFSCSACQKTIKSKFMSGLTQGSLIVVPKT